MTLYQKTLILISATLLGLVIALYFISQPILLNSFTELENADVQRNVERADLALRDPLVELNTTAGDWAPWDETYSFVETPNEAYLQANLSDVTFANLRLNVMLFFNAANQLVFARAFDLEQQVEVEISQPLRDHFANNTLLLTHANPESSFTGFLLLPGELPLWVASRPIVPSDYQGPIRGTLIIGRYMDATQLGALAEKTKLTLSAYPLADFPRPGDPQMTLGALLQQPPIFVHPLDGETVAGYHVMEDVYGQPGLILKTEMRRDIYLQGQATFRYLMAAFLTSGLWIGAALLFGLNKGLLSRLIYLDQSVKTIAANADLTARVPVTGRDELSSLASTVNNLLAGRQQSEESLRRAYQNLETMVADRTAALSEANRRLEMEIEDRNRIEEALVQTRDQAVEASRLKTELLARVSHELRTPLTVISGYAEILDRGMYGPLSPEQHDSLKHIIDSTCYLTTQVSELLDQAKFEAGRIEMDMTAFALTDMMDRIQFQMQALAQSKKLGLTIEVAEDMPKVLVGDPVRLQQVIINLVGNALKFTSEGAVGLSIAREGQYTWTIKVTDTGPGIPAEAHGYIFEPFRQLDGSLTRKHGGAGLGLSIVKQIVLLMRGEVLLESQVGQGSIFTVRLPLIPVLEEIGEAV